MSKVLFLDFDGVFMTVRSKYADSDFDDYAIDRTATGFIANLCGLDDSISIVVISNWRRYPEQCLDKIAEAGLTEFLHEDWRTEWYDSELLVVPALKRGQEIANWLLKHSDVESYRILDDEPYGMADQKARWIACSSDDGLNTEGMASLLTWANPKWVRKTKRSYLP